MYRSINITIQDTPKMSKYDADAKEQRDLSHYLERLLMFMYDLKNNAGGPLYKYLHKQGKLEITTRKLTDLINAKKTSPYNIPCSICNARTSFRGSEAYANRLTIYGVLNDNPVLTCRKCRTHKPMPKLK